MYKYKYRLMPHQVTSKKVGIIVERYRLWGWLWRKFMSTHWLHEYSSDIGWYNYVNTGTEARNIGWWETTEAAEDALGRALLHAKQKEEAFKHPQLGKKPKRVKHTKELVAHARLQGDK